MTTISKAFYKNKPCLEITNGFITADILPDPGAKFASIRTDGREFLLQRPFGTYLEQDYDGIYVNAECSGFDDMFPTIDACFYDEYPWNGVKMADHGEVWSIPWKYRIEKDRVEFSVHGVRFPYELRKCVSFKDQHTIRIDYSLINHSDFDFSFLWAAHIMVNVDEGSQIIVPKHLKRAVTTICKSGRLGTYGDEFSWPSILKSDGTTERIDIIRSPLTDDMFKFYFKDKLKEGLCALLYPDGAMLTLSFPEETVPYLGILVNEGGWDHIYQAILEPCTAAFDRIDAAEARGMGSMLKAKSEYAWHLEIGITTEENRENAIGSEKKGEALVI
jgi:hypothetical protein